MGSLMRWSIAIAVVVALAAAGASCGSSSDEGPTATPSGAATTAQPTATGASAASLTWQVVTAGQSATLTTPTGDKEASQGVWVTIELQVVNGSSTDASVGPADVVFAAADTVYEVSPDTMVAVPNPLVAGTVPAGATAERAVVFDVPQRAWVGGVVVIGGQSAGSAGEITLPLHK